MRQWNRDYITPNGSVIAFIVLFFFIVRYVLQRLKYFISMPCIGTSTVPGAFIDSKKLNTVAQMLFFPPAVHCSSLPFPYANDHSLSVA